MSAPNGWEAVIGLEIHIQLATHSKIFSGAGATFGAEPNSQACPVDIGLPGTLPVLNREAVRMAVMFGLAIGAEINRFSVFDRKNYFYPDLPKGYQISQFEQPIVGRGSIEVPVAAGGAPGKHGGKPSGEPAGEPFATPLAVGITRAHLEEDAGKSIHDLFPGETGVDLNRAGTPLLEVVSDPDLRSPEQAAAFFRRVHSLARYLRICDGDLSQGSMRCDANVSVRTAGEQRLGARTEIKNLNSFRFLEKAVRHEIHRQIDLLEGGGTVLRETRLYDPERDETRPMRSKEQSDDYRYFPDPDLLPLQFGDDFITSVHAAMPELPDARKRRFRERMGLGDYDAAWLTSDPDIAEYFEEAARVGGDAKLAANWVTGEVTRNLNRDGLAIGDAAVRAADLGALIARIRDGTLSGKTAKALFDALWAGEEGGIDGIIQTRGLRQISDRGELQSVVDEVVAAHPAQANRFRAGKRKVLGFFVGQVMQATRGKADPKRINELIVRALRDD